MSFSVKIDGLAALTDGFKATETRLRKELRAALGELGDQLAAAQASRAPRRSGLLARRIKKRLRENGDEVKVVVYPRTDYAFVIERGIAAKSADVKGYARRVKKWDTKRRTLNEKTGKERTRTVSQGVTFVTPHTRRIGAVAPRPYLEPAYQTVRSKILARLDAAIETSKGGL